MPISLIGLHGSVRGHDISGSWVQMLCWVERQLLEMQLQEAGAKLPWQ